MAFPSSRLSLGVELLVNGTYTDITSYVRGSSGISITRGRSAEGSQVDPGQCTLTIENTDGRFSPRNPASPYFGQIGRNTPIRIVTNEGATHADFFGAAGDKFTTPDAAALDITGDIDIRFEFQPDTWNDGTEYELLGKWNTTGNQRSWYITGGNAGTFTLHWSTTGSNDLTAVSTVNGMDSPILRQAFRITLDVNNGAGGYTVTFYRSDTIDGTWEQYDQIVTAAGTTSIFASTAQVEVGDLASVAGTVLSGKFYEIRILNGIDGTEVANPDFTVQTVGATSFADTAGRTWAKGGTASIRNRQIRFWGEVSEWPPRWEVGGFDVTSTLVISGYFRRLKSGADPLQSALRRTLPTTTGLLGYWPLEDGTGADDAASALPSGRPAPVSGFSFGQESSLAASSALPTLLTGATASFVPATGTGGGWTVACVFQISSLPAALTEILRVNVKSSVLSYVVLSASATGIRLEPFNDDGTSVGGVTFSTAGGVAAFQNQWNQLRIRCADNGANVDFTMNWINEDGSDSWFLTTTGTSVNPGNVASVQIKSLAADYIGMSIGHMIVVDANNTFAFNDPITGFSGETANNRVARVVEEEDISFTVVDGSLTRPSEAVGPQRVQTLFDIIQNATDADGGIFYEKRVQRGIQYRDRASLENQSVWLTLPYEDVMAPLEPTDDDQHIENDVTVSRIDGSSARVEQETGPLNTQEPGDDPDAVGRYAASYSLDLDNDDQCEQIAAWKLHLGTWDESRYPKVRVNLARNPEYIAAATRVDVGDRIQITDPPAWLPPGTIDLLVQGYTEYLDQNTWTIEYNCTPYGPWLVAVTNEDTARANTAGCQLAEDLDATETGVDVTTTDGPRWVDSATYASDFPFDIVVGGEVMTVTACTGTTTSQTFTVIRSVNGIAKSHSTGDAVSLAVPTYIAL
ncbi:hypothetical protein ABZ307_28485 [Streptomyces griseorubiginosus]|uniref:hypothetical protein n=1 Tax=Streptomyces griseorubiginosus TaxID=67304 RepID=UPI0033B3C472